MALNIIYDLYTRFDNISAFYTDQGILPRDLIIRHGPSWNFSLYYVHGSYYFQFSMFVLAFLFGLGLMIGYRTKMCSIISYVLFVSLLHRNPYVLSAADRLQAIMLLWCILLPVGNYFSFDRYVSHKYPDRELVSNKIFNFATIGALIHFASVYLFAALYKNNEIWSVNHTAVWRSLNLDYVVNYPATILREYPDLCSMLTIFVYYIELSAIFFLFSPFRNQLLRLFILLILSIMQLSFFIFFEIGPFPMRSLTLHSIFLPSIFWGFLNKSYGNNSIHCSSFIKSKLDVVFQVFAIALLISLFSSKEVLNIVFNSNNYSYNNQLVVNGLKYGAKWNMFRSISLNSTLTQYEGVTVKGDIVDLKKLSFEPPSRDPFTYSYPWYPDYRWRKIIGHGNKGKSIIQKAVRSNLQYWFCQNWNSRMGEENKLEKLRSININIKTNKFDGMKRIKTKEGKYKKVGNNCSSLKYK